MNPEFDTEELMQSLGTGEAVVSMLDEKGAPSMAEYALVLPPQSRMGALTDEERVQTVGNSPLNSKYLEMIDNVSAYEVITGKVPQDDGIQTDTITAPDGQIYGNTSGIPAAAASEPASDEITIDIETSAEEATGSAADQSVTAGSGTTKKKQTVTKAETEEQSGGIGELADSLLGKSGTRQVVRSTGSTIGREI